MTKEWEIATYSGQDVLKEAGPMGRFLFDIAERPGLGIDAERIRGTVIAAPDMYAALIAAKQEMWMAARVQWNKDDFNRWAVIEQINAALTKADGKVRATA